MKTVLIGIAALFAIEAAAAGPEIYSVKTATLNLRDEPVTGQVVGELQRGDTVTVYAKRGEWALLSKPGEDEKWASMTFLAKNAGLIDRSGASASGFSAFPPAKVPSRPAPAAAPAQATAAPPRPAPPLPVYRPTPPPASASASVSTPAPVSSPRPARPPEAMTKPSPSQKPVTSASYTPAPTPPPPPRSSSSYGPSDSRIDRGAFAEAERKFSRHDVDVLKRGAERMIEEGRCQRIEYAYKSTLNQGEYYVYCGNNRRIIFTEADIY